MALTGGVGELNGYSLEVAGSTFALPSEAHHFFWPAKPGQHFEKFAVTVRNTTSDPKPWSLGALHVHDTNGERVNYGMHYAIREADLAWLTTLVPHEERSGIFYVLLSAAQVLGSVSLATYRIGQGWHVTGREAVERLRKEIAEATIRVEFSSQ